MTILANDQIKAFPKTSLFEESKMEKEL